MGLVREMHSMFGYGTNLETGGRVFAITGLIDGRDVTVTWYEPSARHRVGGIGRDRGLDGDHNLVLRAMLDETERQTFPATATGPFIRADLDDPHAAVLQLVSYFRPGLGFYTISGEWPRRVYPVGEDGSRDVASGRTERRLGVPDPRRRRRGLVENS